MNINLVIISVIDSMTFDSFFMHNCNLLSHSEKFPIQEANMSALHLARFKVEAGYMPFAMHFIFNARGS